MLRMQRNFNNFSSFCEFKKRCQGELDNELFVGIWSCLFVDWYEVIIKGILKIWSLGNQVLINLLVNLFMIVDYKVYIFFFRIIEDF